MPFKVVVEKSRIGKGSQSCLDDFIINGRAIGKNGWSAETKALAHGSILPPQP
jgi:hypothetical protein